MEKVEIPSDIKDENKDVRKGEEQDFVKKKDLFESGSVVFVKIPSDISYRPALVMKQDTPLPSDERLVKNFDTGNVSIVKIAYMFEFSVEGELFNQLKYQSEEFVRDIGVVRAIEYLGKDSRTALMQTPAKTPVKSKKNIEMKLSKEDFLTELYDFMEKKGQPISKLPSLGYQELDLYKLYQLVINRGGMDQVTRDQEWKSVYQDLGIPTMSTSASYNTRTNYKKFLYLYELEHFDPPCDDASVNFLFRVGDYVRIVSPMLEGAIFYAQILKKRFQGINVYYVHYNGWSSSHDEWMPENVLSSLNEEESQFPKSLVNPSPSRSSKSNHIIYDPLITEKHYHPKHKRSNSKKSESDDYATTTPSPVKRTRTSSDHEKKLSASADSNKVRLKLRTRLNDLFDKTTLPSIPQTPPISFKNNLEETRKRISFQNLHTFDYFNRRHLDYTDLVKNLNLPRDFNFSFREFPAKPAKSQKSEKYISQVDLKYSDKRSLEEVRESIKKLNQALMETKERKRIQKNLVKDLKMKIKSQQAISMEKQ